MIFTSQTAKSKENMKRFFTMCDVGSDTVHNKPLVLICTYSMLSFSGARTDISKKMIEFISNHEWGLMLIDEVQVFPAKNFSKISETVKAHCKLGLTATLVREDGKISDLHFLIGPKLYEANWIDL